MSIKFRRTLLLAAAVSTISILGSASAAPAQSDGAAMAMAKVPLLPRELFFGNPDRAAVRLSPDGKLLSWLAPRDGVLNIWVAPIGNPAAAHAITTETKRPIQRYSWTPDSRGFLIMKDNDGDENFRLFLVPADGGPARSLIEAKDAQVEIQAVSTRVLDRILVSINDRDPKWADLYSIDLSTGKRSLVLRNDRQLAKFLFDDDLKVRLATHANDDGGYDVYRVVYGVPEAKPYDRIPFEEMQTTRPISYSGDGKTLYWSDSRGRDTAALFAEDVATGKRRLIAADPRADLSDTLNDPVSGIPLAYSVNYLTPEYHPLDKSVAADLKALAGRFGEAFSITSRNVDNSRWTVITDPGDRPYEYWLYDRTGRKLTPLFSSRSDLNGKPLAKMMPREIGSRDGLKLVSYLTLPPGSDPQADGIPDQPLPLVLLVHGGPWNRSEFGFDPTHQMLANRGYAVLDVNFRGSTGFGKHFVSAGDGEWGGKMQDDLIDAVDWAVANRIALRDKVAIMGGSYGGYATLAALTMTPDRFACGVDSAGPSDLQSLLEAMPAQWESLRKQLYRRMGDPTTEAGRAWLKDRSPLFRLDHITKPLLIGQGAKDPRVKSSGPEKVVETMTKHGIPVTYVLYSDEGHGLRRGPNRLSWNAITEQFLAQCLGGRAEPIGDAMKGSTADVKSGANLIAGLQPVR